MYIGVRMKKFLILGISSQLGGVETFIFNYVENMKKQGNDDKYDFVVFDRLPAFVESSPLCQDKFHIIPSRISNPFGYYKGLKEILIKNQYDILWYNACTLSDITLLKMAKKYNVPCRIIHSHNSENMGGKVVGLLHTFHKKQIGKVANEFFACSENAGNYMFPKTICKERMRIIKNAINVEKYQYSETVRFSKRQELGIEKELLIGNVGRFHFQKNHEFIIDIFKKVLKRQKNAKLLLIGNGELKDLIARKIERLQISNNVIFLENRNDVNELLQAIDVFLMPSLFEGLPFALIEAQASDLPCVISENISKEAIITDSVCSLSLEEKPEVWANNIINSTEKHVRKSQVSLFRERGFDISYNAKQIIEYLNQRYME